MRHTVTPLIRHALKYSVRNIDPVLSVSLHSTVVSVMGRLASLGSKTIVWCLVFCQPRRTPINMMNDMSRVGVDYNRNRL